MTDSRVSLGRELHSLRMEKSLSVEALAQVTRIKPDFIRWLEHGELDRLPGQVFGRGFVKNICRALDTDAQRYLTLYEACWRPPEQPKLHVEVEDKTCSRLPVDTARNVKVSPQYLVWGAGIAGVVLVVVLAAWFGLSSSRHPTDGESENPTAAVAKQTDGDEVGGEEAKPIVAEMPPEVTTSDEKEELASAEAMQDAQPQPSDPVSAGSDMSAVTTAEVPPNPAVVDVAKPDEATPGQKNVVTVVVKKKVRAKVRIDSGENRYVNLDPKTYQYEFEEVAQFLIFDAAAVDIIFNGKSIGSLGGPGRVRRIGFAASPEAKARL